MQFGGTQRSKPLEISTVINLTWGEEQEAEAAMRVSEYQLQTIAPRKEVVYDAERHEYMMEIPRLALDHSRFRVAIPEDLPLNEWGGFMIPGHQMLLLSPTLDRMQRVETTCEYLIMTGKIEAEWQDLVIHLMDPRDLEAEMLLWVCFADSCDMPEYDTPAREKFIAEMQLTRLGRMVDEKRVNNAHPAFDLYRLKRTYASDRLYLSAIREHQQRLDHPALYAANYLAGCLAIRPKYEQLLPLFERLQGTRVQLMDDHVRIQIGAEGEERLYWCRYTEQDLTLISTALLTDLRMGAAQEMNAVTMIMASEAGRCPCRMEMLPLRLEQTLKYGLKHLFGTVPGPYSQDELMQHARAWPPT